MNCKMIGLYEFTENDVDVDENIFYYNKIKINIFIFKTHTTESILKKLMLKY